MTPAPPDTTIEDLLAFIKATRGFDFTGYKRSSLERRGGKRMAEVGCERDEDYIDYLELHVWCAGVASGEEADTVARAFVGVRGEQAFKDRVKMYATDADEEALDQA